MDGAGGWTWDVRHESVTGAAHARSGAPNQDRVVHCGHADWFVLALADGHGAAKCLRSQDGAEFAAGVAADALESLGRQAGATHGGKSDADFVRLRQGVVNRWRASVDEDLARRPLADDPAFAGLPERSRAELAANPRLAYGMTLVAALVTPESGLFLQLGDGDIVLVYRGEGGDEVVRPVPPDGRSFANETASLSAPPPPDDDAITRGDALWGEVRVARVPFGPGRPPPGLVLLTTDGFPNAFASDAAFDAAAVAQLHKYASEGGAAVGDGLRGLLTDATTYGSGDDVTVALAFRREVPEACAASGPIRVPGAESCRA